jgi:DNA-binding response OmpR family regulator
MSGERRAGVIMVVDDQPDNLKLLEDMLQRQGYMVRSFPRGRLALASALQQPPDLVLLDINMPEMSGYEVCERLSGDERLRRIPVIFLSALDDVADKVRSFQCGGVDYITKPFQFEEVHARVEMHMLLSALQKELRSQNDHLEEVVRQRTRELDAANQKLQILDKVKSDFLRMIAHELRTPLNGIFGVCQLLIGAAGPVRADEQLVSMFERSRQRILAMVDDACMLTEIEVGAEMFVPTPVSLPLILALACDRAAMLASSRRVTISSLGPGAVAVLGAHDVLVRAITALLEVAVKLSRPGASVQLSLERGPDRVLATIDSVGPVLPEPYVPRFFDLFAIPDSTLPGVELGLSPYLARRLLSLLGGSVTAENRGDSGVRLTVSLVAAPPASQGR